jgi:hypothetical protein
MQWLYLRPKLFCLEGVLFSPIFEAPREGGADSAFWNAFRRPYTGKRKLTLRFKD